jgi:hypothetical protein
LLIESVDQSGPDKRGRCHSGRGSGR